MGSIYSGLSNQQAYSLILAQIELNDELPRLTKWKADQHWNNALVIAAGGMALVIAVTITFNAALNGVVASAVGAAICVLGCAWFDARQTRNRISYLVNLQAGLNQLRAAAGRAPGASASELIASISDVRVRYEEDC